MDSYLFDWGDTLMVDYADMVGKMCDWPRVAATEGAVETLASLSPHAAVYLATGAADSSESDIRQALARVGLERFISGYFCAANLGVTKGHPAFLPRILERLGSPAGQVAMVGDSLDRDIRPAAAAGLQPIWLTASDGALAPPGTRVIASLYELIDRAAN